MYFLITGTVQDEEGRGTFEWVVEADNQEAAIAQLEKGETLVNIREISVEERIEREEKEVLMSVRREYVNKVTENMSIREYCQRREEWHSPELYYLALKFFNQRQRLMRVLKRQRDIGNLSMTEIEAVLSALIDAKTEEEFNRVLAGIKK